MPLSLASVGAENTIRRIGGKPDVKKHLQDMGFVVGENVVVVAAMGENIIVNVKNTRIAINEELARKIMV